MFYGVVLADFGEGLAVGGPDFGVLHEGYCVFEFLEGGFVFDAFALFQEHEGAGFDVLQFFLA